MSSLISAETREERVGVSSEGHDAGGKEHHVRLGGIYQTGALTKGSRFSV